MRQLYKILPFALALISCTAQVRADGYQDLLTLFGEWRRFESPPLLEGAPDYTAERFASRLPSSKATSSVSMPLIQTAGRFSGKSIGTWCALK